MFFCQEEELEPNSVQKHHARPGVTLRASRCRCALCFVFFFLLVVCPRAKAAGLARLCLLRGL